MEKERSESINSVSPMLFDAIDRKLENAKLYPAVNEVLRKGLSKNPKERYQSATDLLQALENVQDSQIDRFSIVRKLGEGGGGDVFHVRHVGHGFAAA